MVNAQHGVGPAGAEVPTATGEAGTTTVGDGGAADTGGVGAGKSGSAFSKLGAVKI